MSCLHVNKKGHMNHLTGLGIELIMYYLYALLKKKKQPPTNQQQKTPQNPTSDFLSLSITKRLFFSNCISGKIGYLVLTSSLYCHQKRHFELQGTVKLF